MKVHGEKITIATNGFSDIRDITERVQEIVRRAGVQAGLANVFVIGSTASISTMEFEPALVEDVKEYLEKFVSHKAATRHGDTWGDDNGFSHIRATFMGPGVTVPLTAGELILGTWQQIVLIDHDNRARRREVFVQVIGE